MTNRAHIVQVEVATECYGAVTFADHGDCESISKVGVSRVGIVAMLGKGSLTHS